MGLTVTGFTVLWSVLLILFIIAEAITVQLVSIWFAIGSLVALIANFCGANTLVQAALFVGVSFAALLLTRPLVKKFSTPKIQRTNIDRIIGERAIVTEEIDNLRAIGIVKATENRGVLVPQTEALYRREASSRCKKSTVLS